MMYTNKFFGSHKIVSCENSAKITKKGIPILKVEFENSDIWFIPEEELNDFTTDEMVDDSSFLEKRSKKLVLPFLEILLESGIQIEWIGSVLNEVQRSINIGLDMATDKLWGKKFINLTLSDIDDVLRDNNSTFTRGVQSNPTSKKKI